jgi:type II secretory pathway pseudopilin PulG
MKPAAGGYTLIEVLLFLAISSVLFVFSGIVLQGQGAHTEFTSSMNDVNSKMQQWIDQVRNGYTASNAGLQNYNCDLDVSTNNPVLSKPAVGSAKDVGTNLKCIFLGKAIMVNGTVGSGPHNVNDRIYAYTVLGRRTYDSGSGQTNVTNLQNANPTAAVYDTDSDGTPDIDLTESYKIPNGVLVKNVFVKGNPGPNNLAGFFIDPTSANNSLIAVQYPLNTNVDPKIFAGGSSDITKCINLSLPSSNCVRAGAPDNLWAMSEWDICFESTHDDELATLRVISSGGSGVVTKLEMGNTGLC